MLDVDEYIHLAFHARSTGKHHACLNYLNEALRQQPENAVALMLVASEHADLGLTDRAIRELIKAVTIDPGMEYARFQLGALLLEKRRASEARMHLNELLESQDEALRGYSEAMLAIADTDYERARGKIAVGLTLHQTNLALARFMKTLLERLSKVDLTPGQPIAQEGADPLPRFLGAYRDVSS